LNFYSLAFVKSPVLKPIISKANLHSTTLLLYLVPRVSNLGLGVSELPIAKHTLSGIFTSIALRVGLNSMSLAWFFSAKIEIV